MGQLNFRQLSSIVKSTFGRFPLAVSSMCLATLAAFALSHQLSEWEVNKTTQLLKIIFGLGIGLPIHFCFAIFNERTQLIKTRKRIVLAIGLVLHIALYAFIQMIPITEEGGMLSLLNALLVVHLLAAVFPFITSFHQQQFWNYNHLLFSTFLSSSFFSVIIYGGLAVAYTAIGTLLSKEMISETLYIDTFICIAGLFHTFYFLSRIPIDLPKELEFSESLSRLITWILAPLVVIYTVILYLYTIKIAWTGTLPEGWVSIWILAFTIIGLLTWLLAYPLLAETSAKRIIKWVKYYFWALIPLLGLMWWAILYRILEYGVTEPRAVILFIAIWLSTVILYVIASNRKTVIFIPTSLLLVAIVYTFGGPISANQLSYRSQLARWQDMMQHPELYTERTINDQLEYLNDWHWSDAKEWMAPLNCHSSMVVLDDNPNESRYVRYQSLDSCLTALELKTMEDTSSIQVSAESSLIKTIQFEKFNIQGYDYLVHSIESFNGGANFVFNKSNFKVEVNTGDQLMLQFSRNGEESSLDLTSSFADFIKANETILQRPIPQFDTPFQFSWEDDEYRYRFQFTHITFQHSLPIKLFNTDGFLLIQKK